jgi:hypothetical protein
MHTDNDLKIIEALLTAHPFPTGSRDKNLFLRHFTEVLRIDLAWQAVIEHLSVELRQQLAEICRERIRENGEIVDCIHRGFAEGMSLTEADVGAAAARQTIASLRKLMHALSVRP